MKTISDELEIKSRELVNNINKLLAEFDREFSNEIDHTSGITYIVEVDKQHRVEEAHHMRVGCPPVIVRSFSPVIKLTFTFEVRG